MRALLGLLLIPFFLSGKSVEMIPNSYVYMDSFKGEYNDYDSAPNKWHKLKHLLKLVGYSIECVWEKDFGKADIILANNYFHFLAKIEKKCPHQKKVLIVWEPPTIDLLLHKPSYYEQFDKVLTWDDSLVDGKKYLKMHYPSFEYPKKNLLSFKERHLVSMFVAHKTSDHPNELYSYRRRIIDYYENRGDMSFHLYGYGWKDAGLKCYLGSVEDKLAYQELYKFAYCFENYDNDVGYITEKIFDCFKTLTVPIYMGASNIRQYIPEGCFIDARKFRSIEEIDHFIRNMDEKTYQTYIQNIMRFCKSRQKNRFTEEAFMKLLMTALLSD